MASENYDEPDHMLDAPPTPGTGDVEDWEDGGLEELVEADIAQVVSGSEEQSGAITTDENSTLEEELAAEIFGSDDEHEHDPIAVDDSDLFGDRIPQQLTAADIANLKPNPKTVANAFFKASTRKPKNYTRTGSSASAQAPIFSQSSTSTLAKVPTKGKFSKSDPKFNPMTIFSLDKKATPGSKLVELTKTNAADKKAVKDASKVADLKAKNKAVEERRASMGVQANAKGAFDQKPDPKEAKTKAAYALKKSKLPSEAVKKGKEQDAMLEREESKRVADLAMTKNLEAMPEHLPQGEMEGQARARQLSGAFLAEAAATSKRKRPEAESSAPSKKTKTSKMTVHKDLSSPHVYEQEDEDEPADEMEGVRVERKILAPKRTKQLDNLKSGSNSLAKKKVNPASAAPQKRNVSEKSALSSKKRRAEEPNERQIKDMANKKRKVENDSPKVVHTLYQHTEAWKMVRGGYKERKEPVPQFVPHVEGQPSPYALHAEKKGHVLPAQPLKEKAKPRTKTTSGHDKFSLAQILAEQEDGAARKLSKEEERMNVRARIYAPDRYQGMAGRMRGSAQAHEVAADVERLRQEKSEREEGFRASTYSAKDRKLDVKAQQKLDKQWRNVNGSDDVEQSKQTQPRPKPRTWSKANEWEKTKVSTDWPVDPSISFKSSGQAVGRRGYLVRSRWGPEEGEMTSEKRAEVEKKWERERTFKGLEKTSSMEAEIDKRTWQEKKGDEDVRKEKEKAMTRKERIELGKEWKEEKTWGNKVGKKIMWRVEGWVKEDEDDDEDDEDE